MGRIRSARRIRARVTHHVRLARRPRWPRWCVTACPLAGILERRGCRRRSGLFKSGVQGSPFLCLSSSIPCTTSARRSATRWCWTTSPVVLSGRQDRCRRAQRHGQVDAAEVDGRHRETQQRRCHARQGRNCGNSVAGTAIDRGQDGAGERRRGCRRHQGAAGADG